MSLNGQKGSVFSFASVDINWMAHMFRSELVDPSPPVKTPLGRTPTRGGLFCSPFPARSPNTSIEFMASGAFPISGTPCRHYLALPGMSLDGIFVAFFVIPRQVLKDYHLYTPNQPPPFTFLDALCTRYLFGVLPFLLHKAFAHLTSFVQIFTLIFF